MAFDGVFLSGIINELNKTVLNGRINKISQPEKDELFFVIRTQEATRRLLISSSPSLPLIYLTDEAKPSPKTAPTFTMLARKHMQNGRIVSISQPDFDRVCDIEIEHTNELGDLVKVHLISEFMGKYSNIILCDSDFTIIDSIKRIPSSVSSVREVLPGRKYFIPGEKKLNPTSLSEDEFINSLRTKKMSVLKGIYTAVSGLSPLVAGQICALAKVDPDLPANSASTDDLKKIYSALSLIFDDIKNGNYKYGIYTGKSPKPEYSCIPLTNGFHLQKEYSSPGKLIADYYKEDSVRVRILQKTHALRRIAETALNRSLKKLQIQKKQLEATDSLDKYKVYGSLLQAFGYSITPGQKEVTLENFYDDNKEITIPLDVNKTPQENANFYFKKYNKLKSTRKNSACLISATESDIDKLRSILLYLGMAESDSDIDEIRSELVQLGIIKKSAAKALEIKSHPMHFISTGGFDIYVGKNNSQNEEVTFKLSSPDDWWFHAKNIAGAHVLLKSGANEPSDRDFEEAASLAAFYSSAGRDIDARVEVDYTKISNIKKPAKSNPGFVIYHKNWSMVAKTDISNIKRIDDN